MTGSTNSNETGKIKLNSNKRTVGKGKNYVGSLVQNSLFKLVWKETVRANRFRIHQRGRYSSDVTFVINRRMDNLLQTAEQMPESIRVSKGRERRGWGEGEKERKSEKLTKTEKGEKMEGIEKEINTKSTGFKKMYL